MSKILSTIKSHIPVFCPKNVKKGAQTAANYDRLMKKVRNDNFQRRFSTTKAGYFPEQPKKSFLAKISEKMKFLHEN